LEFGSPTAQETYAAFIKEWVGPSLRTMGFKGSGGRYRLERPPYQGTLDFQKSQWSNRALVEFTINVAANYGPAHQGFWTSRIGNLLPEDGDLWWGVPAGADVSDLATDVTSSIGDYALVALEAILDSEEFPVDPLRHWALQFEEPSSADNLWPMSFSEQIDQIVGQAPESPNEAFSMLNGSDLSLRTMALAHVYRGSKDDPRLVPALIEALHGDANEHGRSQSAIRLGLVAQSSDHDARTALRRSVEKDEDLMVRLSARYALAFIGRRSRE
jgi:hypothetical protein